MSREADVDWNAINEASYEVQVAAEVAAEQSWYNNDEVHPDNWTAADVAADVVIALAVKYGLTLSRLEPWVEKQ